MDKRKHLKKMLGSGKIVASPGIHDSWGAKIVEDAGFQVCSISGFCLAGSMGFPDLGLMTMDEVVNRSRYIAESVNIPVIGDADTGYGTSINVARTIKEFENAGVAGVHIEDQPNPKRCGAMEGKQVVSTKEMVGRIKAAVDARVDENFLIIARTDAPSITSMEDTIDRCNQYIEAGADVTMAIGHMKREDIIRIGAEVKGWKYGVLTGSGIAPAISLFDLEKMGYQAAGMPLQLLMRQLWVARKMLEDLKTKGTIEHLRPEMVSFDELTQFQNLKKYQEMEAKYD